MTELCCVRERGTSVPWGKPDHSRYHWLNSPAKDGSSNTFSSSVGDMEKIIVRTLLSCSQNLSVLPAASPAGNLHRWTLLKSPSTLTPTRPRSLGMACPRVLSFRQSSPISPLKHLNWKTWPMGLLTMPVTIGSVQCATVWRNYTIISF